MTGPVPIQRRAFVALSVALAVSATLASCSSDAAPAAGSSTPPPAAAPADPAPPTDAEIAAAFAGHEDAHASHHGHHAPAAVRSFPDGIDEPVRIEIAAIGVDADLIDLDLQRPEPEVPTDFDQAGWYTATREPGEIGPSVVAGHIDSTDGPAVFARLDELEDGDEVTVHGADGQTRTFAVTGSGQYPKDQLPPEVFGFGDPVPELRLITCGGSFDRDAGSYTDNLVVYTQLVD